MTVQAGKQLISELKDLHNCRQKHRYTLAIAADYDIAVLWLEKHRNLVKYECKWCYGYHLTRGKWKPYK